VVSLAKLQNVTRFPCSLRGAFRDVVNVKEIIISSLDKLECVDKLCYLGDFIDAGRRAKEVSIARVRCDWA